MSDSYFTQTVLSTRPAGSNDSFTQALKAHGIKALHMPMISIEPPETWDEVDKAIDALEVYSGLVFTSANAVAYFFHRFGELERSVSELPPCHAVGEKTASMLKKAGAEPETVSESGGGIELAEVLGDVDNQFYLHPTSNLGRTEFVNTVAARGGKVNQVITYKTVKPTYNDIRDIDDMLIMGEIDCIAFFSPSAVQSFSALIPEFKQATILIAAIGQTTAAAVATAGLRIDIIAPEQTAESLAQIIAERFKSNERIDFNDGEHIDLA